MSTTFEQVLTDVFDRGAEVRFVDPADEVSAIMAAKDGDESATVALVYAYAPSLRESVQRWRHSHAPTEFSSVPRPVEEWQAIAVHGLLEAVQAFDPSTHRRLAAIISAHLNRASREAMASGMAYAVPDRSVGRFFAIMRKAGGDLAEGARIASDHDMSRETFYAIAESVQVGRIESEALTPEGAARVEASARPIWQNDDSFASAEDRISVEAAFGELDEREREVVRLSFGFADYRPLPDAEIASRLGMTRPTVQRVKSQALAKIRDFFADEA